MAGSNFLVCGRTFGCQKNHVTMLIIGCWEIECQVRGMKSLCVIPRDWAVNVIKRMKNLTKITAHNEFAQFFKALSVFYFEFQSVYMSSTSGIILFHCV